MGKGRIVLYSGVSSTSREDWPENDGTFREPPPWLPLSILTVGSYLRSAGYDVELLDPQIHPDWRERLAKSAPGSIYVGVSCLTGPSIRYVLEAIEIVRANDPAVPIVWGGYHATLAYRSILREQAADVTVYGLGELAACALAEVFAEQSPPHRRRERLMEVRNIAFVDDEAGAMVETTRERGIDMASLPPVDYDLLSPEQYYRDDWRKIPYISSYGCPYACTYCSEPTTSGRQWRPLPPERVVVEADHLMKLYRPDHIDFMDPNFSSDPRRVVAIVEEIERTGVDVRFMCNMRARDVVMISRRIDIARLRDAGFVRIFMGVESGSTRMLKELKKSATVADTLEACRLLSSAGIELHTSFMHDLPTETEEDSAATIRLAEQLAQLPGNFQSHHFFMPFVGTEIYRQHFEGASDDNRSQRIWAQSSTKGSALWRGRPEFRARVVAQLQAIKQRHPEVFWQTPLPIVDI